MILLTDVISQSSNFCWIVLDETTYYITAFAVDSNNAVISSQQTTITTDFWWHPSANTLFYIKNDWDIKDYSQYSHTMNWYGSSSFETLSNGRKVAKITTSSLIYSNTFSQATNKTNFTLHIWAKMNWTIASNDAILWWWCWRVKSDSWTSDKWWFRFQTWASYSNSFIWLAWTGSSDWLNVNTPISYSSSSFVLFSITINWWTYKLYRNWNLVWTTSSSSIRWWSSTWPVFYLWWAVFSDYSLWVQWYPYLIWESVLEDKTESDAEVLNFYNKTKNHYS